jgi:hypothetical protein
MTNADNNTSIIEEEDIIYEQVRNPSTLELMIDPSTGKPRTRRISSIDNPEEYQRLMSQLQEADKRREEAKAAEEELARMNPPVIYQKELDSQGVPHFIEYRRTDFGKYVKTSSVNTSISASGPPSTSNVFEGKYRCLYCSTSWFTEQERSRHMNSHYARTNNNSK